MKITLFFCAGNLAETLGVHHVSDMRGVARRMPWTMAAFTLGALGMIGVPPLAGFMSKWFLGMGAIEAEQPWVIAVLVASSLLNAAYFLPIIYLAWFQPPPETWPDEHTTGRFETGLALLVPPVVTATLAIVVGLLAGMPFSPLAWSKLITFREYGL
jgi:multicomponent Na+:H+ antiporter subunit D